MQRIPNILLMIESSRESGRKLIAGIADYAQHFGPWRFHWVPLGVTGISKHVAVKDFDGLLARDVAHLDESEGKKVPRVVFSYGRNPEPGQVIVAADDAGIAEKVAAEFLGRGFRHFAYCGHRELPWSLNRGHHFVQAIQAAGMATEQHFAEAPETPGKQGLAAQAALARWLQGLPKPVALLASNDEMAHWVVQACHASGLRVPEDCAIIGVDNDPIVCGLCDPPLSSISLDQHRAGFLAAAALDSMMRGKSLESHSIKAAVDGLVVRQSSDLMAVDDPAVARALRFIVQHANRRVSVDEVALAGGLNRRALERRFRACFGQGIQGRCREMRAEYLEKLFRNSPLGFEQIAYECGFSDSAHLTHFYSTVRGELPSQYRKRMGRH